MTALRFRTVVITGASAGIGATFARRLAPHSTRLILLARRQSRLESLAVELQTPQCQVDIRAVDLNDPLQVTQAAEEIAQRTDLDLLINNAGFGIAGRFIDTRLDSILSMNQVHLNATLALTHAILPGMISRRRGGVINVASVAAFLPWSSNVPYAASKAYLVSLSEALQSQVRTTGVQIQALCPGFTHSEFHDVEGMDRKRIPGFLWDRAEFVVDSSLKALQRRQVICVPGWKYQVIVGLARSPFITPIVRAIASRFR